MIGYSGSTQILAENGVPHDPAATAMTPGNPPDEQ